MSRMRRKINSLRRLYPLPNLRIHIMPILKKTAARPWMAKREAHGGRANPNTKFYQSTAWRKLRHLQLHRFPLCAECERKGVATPGKVADHITPINEGGEPLSLENLQTLCDRCHNQKSARESRR